MNGFLAIGLVWVLFGPLIVGVLIIQASRRSPDHDEKRAVDQGLKVVGLLYIATLLAMVFGAF